MPRDRTPLEPRSPKGGRPTREIAKRLSEHILDAALAVLVDHGPEGLTMDIVADRARVSKKTLYSRFTSKDELLAAVINYTLDKHVWKGSIKSSSSVIEQLYATLTAILENTFKPEIVAVEKTFIYNQNEELQHRVRATREVPVRMVVELLLEARRAGEADFDDPRVIAFILLDTMVLGPRARFLMLPVEEREAYAFDAPSRATFDALWRGLLPRPKGV